MATVTVYGASDDLIELEGDIREEFNPHAGYSDDPKPDYLAFSDGTVLSVLYGPDGCWWVRRVHKGTAEMTHVPAEDSSGENYTDRVTLTGDLRWVVFGSAIEPKPTSSAKPKAKA